VSAAGEVVRAPALAPAWLRRAAGVLAVAIVAAFPLFGVPPYLMSLTIEVLIFAIFAMSLDLLLGYTGLVSLGHAAFFAIGAYAVGLVATYASTDILVTTAGALAATALLSLAIGWLSIRLSGFYFLMITFAFAQMVYAVAHRWNWLTGGSNGLVIPGPTLLGQPVMVSKVEIFYVALALFVACWMALRRIAASPFGEVLVGIRENTRRMRAIGFNVRAYKLGAFVLAALFAALAGILYAEFDLFVSPDNANWTQSANVVVMVLIGGAGTLLGPVIGATVVLLLQNWLSSYTEYWSLVLGTLFIVLITGAREGILGLGLRAWRGLHRSGR
jgi:branched-chain amino acid transport system permease protein